MSQYVSNALEILVLPNLKNQQVARITAYYFEDLELFNSIQNAGQEFEHK